MNPVFTIINNININSFIVSCLLYLFNVLYYYYYEHLLLSSYY